MAQFPLRLVSESNQREHWAVKHRRKAAQQIATRLALYNARIPENWGPPKVSRIVFTRLGPRRMDNGNNAGAFKHVEDQVCRWLGIDDGDETIEFVYAQEKSKGYAVRVEVWER